MRLRYRCVAAAATTADTIGPHSKPGWRLTVRKSSTPKIDATPAWANTASANGTPAAASGLVTSSFSASVVSSVNFMASGFGVVDGEAVATWRAYGSWPTVGGSARPRAHSGPGRHLTPVRGPSVPSCSCQPDGWCPPAGHRRPTATQLLLQVL